VVYVWGGNEDWSGKTFKGNFKVDSRVTSLKGCPKIIEGRFSCSCEITTLKGMPEIVKNVTNIEDCQNLISIDYVPKETKGLNVINCKSLKKIDVIPEKFNFLCFQDVPNVKFINLKVIGKIVVNRLMGDLIVDPNIEDLIKKQIELYKKITKKLIYVDKIEKRLETANKVVKIFFQSK
jgi:hypothetical protein